MINIKRIAAATIITAAAISAGFAAKPLLGLISADVNAYKTAAAVETSITNRVMCGGTVEEASSELIFPDTASKILEIYVKPGDIVAPGDRLFLVKTLSAAEIEDIAVFSSISSGLGNLGAYNYNAADEASYPGDIWSSPFPFVYPGALDSSSQNSALKVENRVITADVGGIVSSVYSVKNLFCSPVLPLAKIIDTSSLLVRAKIPEAYSSDIQPGQKAQITGDGFPSRTLSGEVVSVMPFANQTGTLLSSGETVVEALIALDGSTDGIKPGFNVSLSIVTDNKPNSVVIPYEAIYADEQGGEYVFKIVGSRVVKERISTGYELESSIEATTGVRGGDTLILNPAADILENGGLRLEDGESSARKDGR